MFCIGESHNTVYVAAHDSPSLNITAEKITKSVVQELMVIYAETLLASDQPAEFIIWY